MMKRISIFWIIMIALLVTSALPLSVLAVRATEITESGVEAEQRNQLLARADAHASAIDQQFRKFEIATQLAAVEAAGLLLADPPALDNSEIARRMSRYQREGPDSDVITYDGENPYELGVLGLDTWYNNVYLPENPGSNRQSNVFLSNQTALTPAIEHQIAVTEDLNPIFEGIRNSQIGTQWVYLTTAEGMMRLYPWAGNDGYPVNWEPHTIGFYTVAAEERNPDRGPVWTAPYNDYAGAGVMVTNSYPIYDGDRLVAVMSHDFVIRDLQRQVLGFEVGEQGFAFLVDNAGNIIAHPDYDPENTPRGEELNIKLGYIVPGMPSVVDEMLARERGLTVYTDSEQNDWIVVYSTIESTDWHLGLMQPRSEIIQPAIDIRSGLLPIAIGLAALVLFASVLVARGIAQPVRHLTSTADTIEAKVGDREGVSVAAQQLAQVRGTREISRLATVMNSMVNALTRRMNELDSIYAMGQTITSNVDYEKTLQAVLSAVRQVVRYDAAELAIVQGEDLVVQAWQGDTSLRNTTGRTQRIGAGVMGVVAANRAPIFLPSITTVDEIRRALNQPDFDGNLVLESGLKSLLGIPLIMGNNLIGVLVLVHKTLRHFTEDDQRQLLKLSAQASVAISNAIQVRQRESALKKQIRELQIEIDDAKKSKQVKDIVETDFFRELQSKAESMRARAKSGDQPPLRQGSPLTPTE